MSIDRRRTYAVTLGVGGGIICCTIVVAVVVLVVVLLLLLYRVISISQLGFIADIVVYIVRYAIQAVIVQIKIDRKKTFDWRRLVRRLHDKLVYIDLWKSKLVSNQVLLQRLEAACISLNTDYRFFERNQSALYQQILAEAKALQRFAEANKGSTDVDFQSKNPRIVKPLEQDTMELLRAIEYELTFEDIILFRSLAEKQLSREVTQQSWLSGVFSWLSGSKTSQVAEEEKVYSRCRGTLVRSCSVWGWFDVMLDLCKIH